MAMAHQSEISCVMNSPMKKWVTSQCDYAYNMTMWKCVQYDNVTMDTMWLYVYTTIMSNAVVHILIRQDIGSFYRQDLVRIIRVVKV